MRRNETVSNRGSELSTCAENCAETMLGEPTAICFQNILMRSQIALSLIRILQIDYIVVAT